MRALVISHDHIGDPGHLGAALVAAGWTLSRLTVVPEHRFARPDVTVTFPDLVGIDLVLTLGAPWPRADITSWTGTEVAFLAGAHRRGVPVLGVCAGAQFLAEALGGGVAPLGGTRRGWGTVRPRGAGVPDGPWFRWQSDRIVAPSGAEVLADGPDATVEAFRVGSSVGVQFHPEMSPGLLDRWLAVTPLGAAETGRLRAEALRHEADAAPRAARLLRGLGVVA